MDRTIKIDEETYQNLRKQKEKTGVPIKRIIKDSVAKKRKDNKNDSTKS